MAKVGRNEPCPCGSGKKYKSCCLTKDEVESTRTAKLEELKRNVYDEAISNFKAMDRLETKIADLLKRGKLDQAEKLAVEIADRHPEFPNGIERLADVFAARGDHAKAADLYEKAATSSRTGSSTTPSSPRSCSASRRARGRSSDRARDDRHHCSSWPERPRRSNARGTIRIARGRRTVIATQ